MSDDLREQIARALIRERQRRLAGVSMDAALADADAVLAVVRPVIEQAERERDEWKAAEAEARMTIGDEAARHMLRADAAEARVATLEAALDRIAHHPITQSSDAVMLRQIARDALDEQDTTPPDDDYRMWQRAAEAPTVYSAPLPAPERCPTCRSDDPARQQGLPHTDLHAQIRCRDPWHVAPPVEEDPDER